MNLLIIHINCQEKNSCIQVILPTYFQAPNYIPFENYQNSFGKNEILMLEIKQKDHTLIQQIKKIIMTYLPLYFSIHFMMS